MDGSDVTVVILGEKGVGKTTFIEHCFEDASGSARLSRHAKVMICGREVSIRMVDNPGKSQLIPAMMVIVLFDLTNKHTFEGLNRMLKLAQRVSPVALKAVVGTKAELIEERKVESQNVESLIEEFCCEHSEGTQTIPYYETALVPSDSIFIAFQEIIARPLINDYVIKAATDQEQISFAHEVMEWSITHNSANILTHLRKLGYAIPQSIIKRFPVVIRDYLLAEYPLRVMPQFTYVDLPPPNFGLEDSSFLEDFDEEPQSLHDIRPTIEVMRTYHLCWKDISLYCFLPEFLSPDVIDVRRLTHIDLSNNRLSSLPSKILKLPRLESLNISHNQLTCLPALESWHPASKLQVLVASHNQIVISNQSHLVQGRGSSGSREREPFHDLWYVDLSHNQLTSFPMFIFNFRQLHHLNISHNTQITKLPTQLGRLKNLVTLDLDGLSLFHPPSFVVEEGTAAILDFMRGKISHSSPWSSMRVIVVGAKGTGKTSLIKRVKGESTSFFTVTRGLDVTEWKYKGGDLLSFRNKLLTFDVWDFSGDPDYCSIYSCFDCSSSLHLVICKPSDSPRELVRWLSDIQARSVHRIPVVIVFTFMDNFRTRDEREEFKKKTLNWISYHNMKGDQLKGVSLSLSSMMDSVRSLQGGDAFVPSHELPPEAFEMQEVTNEDIPIMPLVVKTLFVSNATGENVSNVRKLIYKLASNPPMAPSPCIANFNLIGQEVPTSYIHIEQLIRQLRLKVQQNPRDGERPAFYTLPELRQMLSKHLLDLNISDATFAAALKFLHEVGVIYLYKCRGGGPLLICVDLQMMGNLLQMTLRAPCAPQSGSHPACYLANTHLAMIWGVEQVVLVQQDNKAKEGCGNQPSSQNLLDYLYHLDICSPLFPGTSLLPSTIPSSLPKGSEPDPASLLPRRVYILNFMPTLFAFQLLSRLVSALVRDSVPSLPVSPSQTAPPPTVPLILPSGMQLYLWRRNVFVVDPADGSKFWVHVREGRLENEGEELPYAGRVDVQVEAGPEREVKWLRLITAEIDHLLKVDYPTLLESQRCVEVCATLSLPETLEETSDPSDLELSSDRPPLTAIPVSELTLSVNSNKTAATSCQPLPSANANQLPTSPQTPSSEAETSSLSKQPDYSQSWEVLSRQSTTSTLLSMRQDTSSPNQQLIPLWECLQEAFKTPMVRVGSHRVKLQQVIPDLLFNDFAPELLFRTTLSSPDKFLMSLEEHMNGGIPPPEATGRYLHLYYTQEDEDHCLMKPAGAEKAFYLQSCLVHLRSDFFRLQQLQSPHLVLPLGVNFSPPCMALESAPHGSLRQLLRDNRGASIGRNIIHHIALQLIACLEFLHIHKFRYHGINSDNVLIWNLDPIIVKLSDSGITHPPSNCNLCSYLDSTLGDGVRRSISQRIDYILLGLLVFEMATGKAPYEDIHPLSTVVRAILHNKIRLNIEAQHFLQTKLQEESTDCEQSVATGCQRLCLQSTMDECILRDPVNHRDVKTRFSVCAGDHLWSPMRMLVNVECMLCSEDAELVYWASGSRGLVTGTIAPHTGHLDYNILQEAPPPESGLFADRRCKPVPIAVGRATGLALVQRTNQLWVSTENGQMGSVYVFNLPDMRRHHHIHLQDAALCVQAINDKTGTEEVACRALVGLANGTIIIFLGVAEDGRVLENPLQGRRCVVVTQQRRPCLSFSLAPSGHIWCSCGDTMEVLDATKMGIIRHLAISEASLNSGRSQRSGSKGDIITLMAVNGRGVWTVGRRSKQLKLWDQITAALKGSFTAVTAYDQERCDITALAVQGGVVWLGTRNGYILLLDAGVMEEGGDPLLGLQYCGAGKVRCIIPLSPHKGLTKSLQVMCSIEFPDEVSGVLLCWEYLASSRTGSSHPYMLSRSASAPTPVPTGQESPCLDLREQCKPFSPTSF